MPFIILFYFFFFQKKKKMSKLNRDILFLLFEELQNNSRFLFSCLMVNRIWCETVIPILWRNPWCHATNYRNRNSLYFIITSYLSDDFKKFLMKDGIQISGKSVAFDYLSFCRSIDIKMIDDIISIGFLSEYHQFLLQEEIYSFLIKKCPEIKYLNICGTYDIVYLPETKARLESLCELTCDTLIDTNYFYRLAHVCQQIERITIISKKSEANHGTTKLIEFQKNLKYFKWVDEFDDECYYNLSNDLYLDIFNVLKKHANTLTQFEISLQHDYNDIYTVHEDYDYTFLQYALLKLHNLKIVEIDSPPFLNNYDFNKKLEMATYHDLEIFKIDVIDVYQAICIIKNSSYLRELCIHEYHWNNDSFNDDSLNFIRTISENCFLIEYLSIPMFPLLENHFIEFENLLKKCQKLQSLYFKGKWNYGEEKKLAYSDYLSRVLTRDASINLNKIGIPYNVKFSLKTLETFFEKWKGRPAVSIYASDNFYQRDNSPKSTRTILNRSYMELINKYKIEGVIKYINVQIIHLDN
jgi:hypothetical protein